MIFLNEKDSPTERDEIDLLTGSGGEDGPGRAWAGTILSNLISAAGKKILLLFL
jgi:hypothetical protein